MSKFGGIMKERTQRKGVSYAPNHFDGVGRRFHPADSPSGDAADSNECLKLLKRGRRALIQQAEGKRLRIIPALRHGPARDFISDSDSPYDCIRFKLKQGRCLDGK